MTPDLNGPEVRALTTTVDQLAEYTADYAITNRNDYVCAADDLKRVKAAAKTLDDVRKSFTTPLDTAKRAIMDFFHLPGDRLDQAESRIKRAMAAYQEQQERLRIEDQRRGDEAARKERERLAEQRRAAEAKARGEAAEARRLADEAAAAGRAAEAAKLAAKAERIDERAAEKVEALQLREAMVVAPVVNREPPKVAGVNTRLVWKYRITDAAKLNPAFMLPDEAKIGKAVRAMGADAAGVIGEGIEIWSERQIAAGAA